MWFETDTVFILRRYVLKCLEKKSIMFALTFKYFNNKKGYVCIWREKDRRGRKRGREGRGGEGKGLRGKQ